MQKDFTRNVLKIVGRIPKGHLMTYSQVAKRSGSVKAYRAVGNILHKNFREAQKQLPLAEFRPVPCHRVIRSDGYLGGYAQGSQKKQNLLEKEGHVINNGRIVIQKLN